MPETSATPVVRKRLTQLAAAAGRLEAMSAIKRLQRAYGYYIDAGRWDEAADLFADDATIEIGLDGVYRGRERIRQYLRALGDGRTGLSEGELRECFQLQPVITVAADGRSAQGRWRAFVMAGRYGERAVWGEGPYENEYVLENGVWKISRLHWYQTFVVPYEGGWVKNPDATGGTYVSGRLPPDAPPSEPYGVWPDVHTPPLHYDSPVRAVKQPTRMRRPKDADAATMAVVDAITALERQVSRLDDVAQIENLISAYGYCLDKQLWDRLADLFADDATMEISQRGVYVGKPSIRRALELFGPQGIQPNHVHNHFQIQPLIHIARNGQRAWARSRAISQLGTYQGMGIWHGGVYENEFVKEGGIWKYQRDHVYTTYFALCEPGWKEGPRPAAMPSASIPPDLPPSEVYEAFPGVYTPAFHYRHPVTGRKVRTAARSPVTPVAPPREQAEQVVSNLPADLPPPLQAAREQLAGLAQRVQRLQDEQAIERLQRAYGYFVDKGLRKETADLFATDGTLEIGGRGVFAGKRRVLDYLKWLQPEGLVRGKLFDHLQLQPIVSIGADGRTAQGRWRFFAQVGEYQKTALWGVGTYENEYVKEDGVWKIVTLHSYFRMYTTYEDGWAKTALPITHPEADLPPDRPPSVEPEHYPQTFVPGYHYRNPVTGE